MKSIAKITYLSLISLMTLASFGCRPRRHLVSRTLSRNILKGHNLFDENLDNTQKAIDRKDYVTAEADVRQTIAMSPGSSLFQCSLGSILLLEHKNKEAQSALKKYVDDPMNGITDNVFLKQYAELSYSLGKLSDASSAYRRILDLGSMFPRAMRPEGSEPMSLSELRASACASTANYYRGQPTLYLKLTDEAVAMDPHASFSRIVHADALYVYGRLADSRKEFSLAEKMDPARAKAIESFIKGFYEFDRIDHRSEGVIGPDGKLTVKHIPIPLPNDYWRGRGKTNPTQEVPKPTP